MSSSTAPAGPHEIELISGQSVAFLIRFHVFIVRVESYQSRIRSDPQIVLIITDNGHHGIHLKPVGLGIPFENFSGTFFKLIQAVGSADPKDIRGWVLIYKIQGIGADGCGVFRKLNRFGPFMVPIQISPDASSHMERDPHAKASWLTLFWSSGSYL